MNPAWASLVLIGCAAPSQPGPTSQPREEFTLTSSDGRSELVVEGLFQTTASLLSEERDPGTVLNLKRVRPELSGHVDWVRFKFEPKFTVDEVQLEEAWIGADLALGDTRLMLGRIKVPFGLEEVRSRRHIDFPSFSLINQLSPAEDQGLHLDGTSGAGAWEYGLSITSGESGSKGRSGGEVGARVMAHPFHGRAASPLRRLGLGIAATVARARGKVGGRGLTNEAGSDVVTYNSGTHLHGMRSRIGIEGEWSLGPIFTQAELVHLRQHMGPAGMTAEPVDLRGGYLTLSYALTGEDKTFAGLQPSSPMSPGSPSGRGAWVLAMRVAEVDVDEDIAAMGLTIPGQYTDRIQSASLGLNWIPNAHAIVRNAVIWSRYGDSIEQGSGRDDSEVALVIELQLHF